MFFFIRPNMLTHISKTKVVIIALSIINHCNQLSQVKMRFEIDCFLNTTNCVLLVIKPIVFNCILALKLIDSIFTLIHF